MRDDPARPVAPDPPSPDEPIEWRAALGAVWVTLALGAVFVAGAGLLLDRRAVLGAAIGVAVVAGTLLLSGATMSLAAPFGPSALMAAVLGGYVLKLVIYAMLIVLLGDVEAIDGPSLAVTAAILLVVALVWQTRRILRDRRLFWVMASGPRDAQGAPGGVVYTSGHRPPHHAPDPQGTERTSA